MDFNNFTIIMGSRGQGKRIATIDYFINRLSEKAKHYGVKIESVYNPKNMMLEIRASCYDLYNFYSINTNYLIRKMPNLTQDVDELIEKIKEHFIASFEYLESERPEPEVDERWEFIELGGM